MHQKILPSEGKGNTEWEKIFSDHTSDKRLILKYIEILKFNKTPQTKQLNLKMGKDFDRHFSKKDNKNGQ